MSATTTLWLTLTNATLDDASAQASEKSAALWATKGWASTPPTGATAGKPGYWTPAGADPPATVAAIGAATASPSTAWTTGQYVQTDKAGAAGKAHWSGSAWVAGVAP